MEPACREEDHREEAAAHSAEAGPGQGEDGRREEVSKSEEHTGQRTGAARWQEALREQRRQGEAREEQRQEAELSGSRGGQGRRDEEEQREQDVQAGRRRRAQDPFDERASRLEEHGEGEETPEEGGHVVLRADRRQIRLHEHPQEFPRQREAEGVLRDGKEPQARLLSPPVTLISRHRRECNAASSSVDSCQVKTRARRPPVS